MDQQTVKNELIVKTTLELLQNVLPTNIMSNLDQLDGISDSDPGDFTSDLDEERFFFEKFVQNQSQSNTTESTDELKEAATTTIADAEVTYEAAAVDATFHEPQFVAVSEFNGNGERIDNNSSLTYFEIVEQEMMQSIPVASQNISVWTVT